MQDPYCMAQINCELRLGLEIEASIKFGLMFSPITRQGSLAVLHYGVIISQGYLSYLQLLNRISIAGCRKIFLPTDKHLTGNQMFSFKFVDLQILFENVKCQNMMTLLCYSFLFNAYFSQSCFTLQLVVSIHT